MTELKQSTTTINDKDVVVWGPVETNGPIRRQVGTKVAATSLPLSQVETNVADRYIYTEVKERFVKEEPAILIETGWEAWKRTDEFPQQLYDEVLWEHQIDNKKASTELEAAIRQTRFHRMRNQQRTFDWGLDPPLTAAFVSFWTKAGAVSVRAYETEIENWWVELVVS